MKDLWAAWRPLALAAILVLATLVSAAVSAAAGVPRLFAGPVAYTNPVIGLDFADPAVIHAADGWYYAYSTEQLTVERMAYIQVARSRDLVGWELLPDAMPTIPAWADQTRDFWAPGAIEADGRYYLYFAALGNSRAARSPSAAALDVAVHALVHPERAVHCIHRHDAWHRVHHQMAALRVDFEHGPGVQPQLHSKALRDRHTAAARNDCSHPYSRTAMP